MRSIKTRILWFAVLATVAPALGLGLLSFLNYQALIASNVAIELRTQANYVRSEVTLWLRDRIGEVRALATANTLIDGLLPASGGTERAQAPGTRGLELYLRSVRGRLDAIVELTLYDDDGRPLASTAEAQPPQDLPPGWRDRLGDEGAIVGAPRWDSAHSGASLTVLVPVQSPRDARLGALLAVLDLGRLQPRLLRLVRGAPAETILLSPEGRPLLGTHGVAADFVRVGPETLARLQSPAGALVDYVGHRGRTAVGIAGAMDRPAFLVVSERLHSDVYQAWLKALALFAGLVAGVALFVGGVAYWTGRSIVKPLERLMNAAERVGAGDLDVRERAEDRAEVGRLARAFNAMVDRLRESRAQVAATTEALQRQNALLETLSITDALTGLSNRKRLDDVLGEQFALYRRTRRPYFVVMLDIDHFKRLNDTWGHLVGDRVLAHVAALVRRAVRDVDHVARYGGEEFAAVLVDTSPEGAIEAANRIRAMVESTPATLDEGQVPATVSVGVARVRDEDTRPDQAIGRADAALYEAKRAGRNRVVGAL